MIIDKQLVLHPCFCANDYKYQKAHGKNDAEILERWDRALRKGYGPIIHSHGVSLQAI